MSKSFAHAHYVGTKIAGVSIFPLQRSKYTWSCNRSRGSYCYGVAELAMEGGGGGGCDESYQERQEDEVEFLQAVFPEGFLDLRQNDPWDVRTRSLDGPKNVLCVR